MKLDKILLNAFWVGLAIVCPVAVGWSLVSCNGYTNKAYEVGIVVGGIISVGSFCVIASVFFENK